MALSNMGSRTRCLSDTQKTPCAFSCLSGLRSRPASAPSARKVCVRAAQQEDRATEGSAFSFNAGAECADDVFPSFEAPAGDEGLFPKRQPGEFPPVELEDKPSEEVAEYDPLRDGPLRYLGYANECGEAFAAWLPVGGVPLSYAVAVGYVVVDTVDKGLKAYRKAETDLVNLDPAVDVPRLTKLLSFERGMDTIVWQLLASVICPGYTIHTVVWLVHEALARLEVLEPVRQAVDGVAPALALQSDVLMATMDKSLPTAMGLAAIPFIVHPIDNGIHALLNASLRPAMKSYICGPGQGSLAGLDLCNESCIPEPASSSNGANGTGH